MQGLLHGVGDEDGDGGEEGGDGHPHGDAAQGVLVVVRLSHTHLVRLNVDDVVLLNIVDGRGENVLRTDVHVVGFDRPPDAAP